MLHDMTGQDKAHLGACNICREGGEGGVRDLASSILCMHTLQDIGGTDVIQAKAGSTPVGGVGMAAIGCRRNTKPVLQLSYIRICWSFSRG